jgi:import inner membrane translocase subunit TIM23
MNWGDFFTLRRQQRRINIASSVVTALVGSTASWSYLANVEIDPTQLIFGFDPFMIFFAGFMGATGVGYMFGPLLGNLVFRVSNSSKIHQYKAKNKEFLEKVSRNRVDPSSQSFSNPVPDYYGEKIDGLKSYRQWLRDCHAYRRKAKEFL